MRPESSEYFRWNRPEELSGMPEVVAQLEDTPGPRAT